MKSTWIVRLFQIALLATIIIAGFGQAVLQLWNLLMPGIFGLPLISFWQAVGLMGLSWILFGGLGIFRGRPMWGSRSRHRWAERLEQMPVEERERLRQALKHHCGPPEGPATGQPS